MRLTTDRRGAIVLMAALAFALAGCDSKSKSGGAVPDTTATSSGNGPAISGPPTARQAADEFLRDLGANKVTADRLTPEFAAAVARKRTGDEVNDWLSTFKGTTFVVGNGEEARFGDAIALRGRAQGPGGAEAFAVRLIKTGNTYKADWLHRSSRQGSEIRPQADPDLAAAQDTVRNFLDLLLGGELRLAHALMAPAWKKALSPPDPTDVRVGFDYGPGFLDQKLRSWRGVNFLGYTLTKADLDPNKIAVTFAAELAAEGQKIAYVVKAAKDPATGRWLVTDFDPR